jgi:DNA gyrase subunit A
MIRVREFDETQHLVMATAKGRGQEDQPGDFRNIRRDGIIAINIDEGDADRRALTGGRTRSCWPPARA